MLNHVFRKLFPTQTSSVRKQQHQVAAVHILVIQTPLPTPKPVPIYLGQAVWVFLQANIILAPQMQEVAI